MMLLTQENRKQLPKLYAQEKSKDPMVYVKFFTPWTQWTWYATEFDGDDTFFGWVVGQEKELGYFSLSELESVNGPFGLKIERDRNFTPRPLSEVKVLHNVGVKSEPVRYTQGPKKKSRKGSSSSLGTTR